MVHKTKTILVGRLSINNSHADGNDLSKTNRCSLRHNMLWYSLVVVCLCLSVYKGDLEN